MKYDQDDFLVFEDGETWEGLCEQIDSLGYDCIVNNGNSRTWKNAHSRLYAWYDYETQAVEVSVKSGLPTGQRWMVQLTNDIIKDDRFGIWSEHPNIIDIIKRTMEYECVEVNVGIMKEVAVLDKESGVVSVLSDNNLCIYTDDWPAMLELCHTLPDFYGKSNV